MFERCREAVTPSTYLRRARGLTSSKERGGVPSAKGARGERNVGWFGFRAHVAKTAGTRSSRLEKSLTVLPLACSFDLYVADRGDAGGQSDLFAVVLDTAKASTYVLIFGITPSSTYLGEYIENADGGATPTVSVPNLTDRRWTHVTIALAPPVAKLTLDGTLVKTLSLFYRSVSVTAMQAGITLARAAPHPVAGSYFTV